MASIKQVIYVSTAYEQMSENELLKILKVARENNANLGITGLLLYNDGCFIQVLEGAPDLIEQLMSEIATDERHTGIITISEEYIEEKEFDDWSMGFRNITDSNIEGFNKTFSGYTQAKESNIGTAKSLLYRFRDLNRGM